MKEITNYDGMVGKEISEVRLVDSCEIMVLKFVDGTYASIAARDGHKNPEIDITEGEVSDYGMYKAGLITISDYKQMEKEKAIERKQAKIDMDLRMLKELKEKYEGIDG